MGAIFSVTVPAMMIKSDCRGLGRKMPAPNRSMSNREAPVAIISIAQQARPKVIGQRADLRAQLNRKSAAVVTIFFSNRFSIQAGTFFSVFQAVGVVYDRPGLTERPYNYAQFNAPFLMIQTYPTIKMPRKTTISINPNKASCL